MNRFLKTTFVTGFATGFATLALTATIMSGPTFAREHDSGDRGISRDINDKGDEPDITAPAAGTGFSLHLPHFQLHNVSDASQINRDIQHWRGSRFDVQTLADLTDGDASALTSRAAEPGYLAGLHGAIQHNPGLQSRLTAQNVEIGNVIGAEPAADGSMTFYVQ